MKQERKRTSGGLEEFSLFDNEERIASESEDMVGMLHQVVERLRLLSKAYRQSLHEQQRLVRLSDRNQLELHNANRRLAEQAEELTRLNDALHAEMGRRAELAEELQRQATVDDLTGAATRRHFFVVAETAMEQALRHREPLSVVLIDLDRFKQINDHYGHAGGDEVLRAFGELCREVLRRIDIVGRLGGEEFAVVLPRTDLAAAGGAAERLLERVNATEVEVEGRGRLTFGFSAGVAELQAGETTIEPVLARADAALYAAKAAGRGRIEIYRDRPQKAKAG